ncbi:hypothetical protein [Erythrobacter sp. KY5]|uniref:hypothetical protein n=1 Tax=Erythrobacter sp. KY5 TaxID=2011159 RepID=UPI0013A6E1AB|nr:hypothetical protein [Erythrobacter sp. KY5]
MFDFDQKYARTRFLAAAAHRWPTLMQADMPFCNREKRRNITRTQSLALMTLRQCGSCESFSAISADFQRL